LEIIKLNPIDITVKEGLDRFRTDMGDLEGLAGSFKNTRQILPIVINRKHELIDGGRRLAACILAGIQVYCVYQDVVDPFEMRKLELEANLYRKDYTPPEEALAVAELVKLNAKDGMSQTATAKALKKTKGYVSQQLDLAEMIKAFPALKAAKKKSEITKAAKGLTKVLTTLTKLEEHEAKIAKGGEPFTLVEADALLHMKEMPSGSINILCTDPLYGIEAHELAIGVGGQTGSTFTIAGYQIPDNFDQALNAYLVLSKESFRFCADDAHGYVFCAPEHFSTIRQLFLDAGWRAYIKPLIWTKKTSGQCNVPAAWPASCYEMLLYIRKEASRIVKQGMPDWLDCPPVNEGDKLHTYEKPIPLLNNLLERVALPGLSVYDPFMGSGSSVEAAVRLNMSAIGCDNSHEAYASAVKRMAEMEKVSPTGN